MVNITTIPMFFLEEKKNHLNQYSVVPPAWQRKLSNMYTRGVVQIKKITYSRVAFVKDKHLKEHCQVSILENCFSEMSILGL